MDFPPSEVVMGMQLLLEKPHARQEKPITPLIDTQHTTTIMDKHCVVG